MEPQYLVPWLIEFRLINLDLTLFFGNVPRDKNHHLSTGCENPALSIGG